MEIGGNAKQKAINTGGSIMGVAKVSKIGKESQDQISAKWDDASNLIFVELLEEEIEKINDDFAKFRDKDLSLLWLCYGPIFDNVVAIDERARAPFQVPIPTQKSDDEYESSCDSNDISNADKQAPTTNDETHMFPRLKPK